jgi:hypothetical protein
VFVLPPIDNYHVVVAPHTTFLACIWIQPGVHSLFSIAAYKQYVCTHFQIGRGIIFNPTWMQQVINDFLSRYSLQSAYISFIPDYTSVLHGFVAKQQLLSPDTVREAYKLRHVVSGSDYLYMDEKHNHVYYWYQISHALLLQYQCVIVMGRLNCVRITPRFCALLHAYRAIQGSAFRRTQLGIDLCKYDNRLSRYFRNDIVRRLISVQDNLALTEEHTRLDVIAAAGIAYLHKENI